MSEVIKKLQYKEGITPVLIINAPSSYKNVMEEFSAGVHQEAVLENYDFVQIFGTTNEELQRLAKSFERHVIENGLFWLCYPKKTSIAYKGSDCSRETVTVMLSDEGYEPVRQVAIDDDWSALRFRKVEHIKTMTRSFAVSQKGKERMELKNE